MVTSFYRQASGGDVRRRLQRLRRAEDRARRDLAVHGRGFRRGAVHLDKRPHRVRAVPHHGGARDHGLGLRVLQVRRRLRLHPTHRRAHGLLRKLLFVLFEL